MKYIIQKDGYRLCKDNKLRSFAMFGTFSSCVKIYSRISFAQKAAKKIGGEIICLKKGESMDASGKVQKKLLTN